MSQKCDAVTAYNASVRRLSRFAVSRSRRRRPVRDEAGPASPQKFGCKNIPPAGQAWAELGLYTYLNDKKPRRSLANIIQANITSVHDGLCSVPVRADGLRSIAVAEAVSACKITFDVQSMLTSAVWPASLPRSQQHGI